MQVGHQEMKWKGNKKPKAQGLLPWGGKQFLRHKWLAWLFSLQAMAEAPLQKCEQELQVAVVINYTWVSQWGNWDKAGK